jgi:hypothetical protein
MRSGEEDDMAKVQEPPAEALPLLDDVELAFAKRRELARRLADQDLYIGNAVRKAREKGATWSSIASKAHLSDVAVIKAARRPEKVAA